jgi:hypothetical protein
MTTSRFARTFQLAASASTMLGNPVEDERDSGLKPNTIPL